MGSVTTLSAVLGFVAFRAELSCSCLPPQLGPPGCPCALGMWLSSAKQNGLSHSVSGEGVRREFFTKYRMAWTAYGVLYGTQMCANFFGFPSKAPHLIRFLCWQEKAVSSPLWFFLAGRIHIYPLLKTSP